MKILIYLYPGMNLLDAVGPYSVLRNLEGADIKFVGKKKGDISSDSHFAQLKAQYSIKEVRQAEILIIPGSPLTFLREAKDKKVLEWIRAVNETSHTTLGIGSGSIILAAAGLLKGLEATSHWKTREILSDHGAKPVNERFVEQGKFLTAAGGSAAIDVTLYIANLLKGQNEAKAAQLVMAYDPAPMFNTGNPDNAEEEIIQLAEKQMNLEAGKDLSWWQKIRNSKSLKKLKK